MRPWLRFNWALERADASDGLEAHGGPGTVTSAVPAEQFNADGRRQRRGFAGDPTGIGRREEKCGARDVVGLSDPAQRRLRDICFSKSLPMIPAECVPSVSTPPGLRALTRIFRGPSSFESDLVIVSTAAFVAE